MSIAGRNPHVANFIYENSKLHVENVALEAIARKVATPFYVYSAKSIVERYRALENALAPLGVNICFAMKANCTLSILRLFADMGSGVDLVSGGELKRAQEAGFDASKMVFSGVGKTDVEIEAALRAGVGQLNVESVEELQEINRIAGNIGRIATVALRINPDVDAKTHPKITTGSAGNKFGIDYRDAGTIFELAAGLEHVRLNRLAVHIGSQITTLDPYRNAYRRLARVVEDLRGDGFMVDHLDLGGGFGVTYNSEPAFDVAAYAAIINETLSALGCTMMIEPGRYLIAEAGALVTKVLYNKQADGERVSIVDAAMNDLMRPALYDSRHPIWTIHETVSDVRSTVSHIVGPVCESSDSFGRYTHLPELKQGELIVIGVAGAYGSSMSSTYNSRALVQEILVSGEEVHLIRRAQNISDQLQYETPAVTIGV